MFAFTNLSNNKIGDSNEDITHFVVFCWPFYLSLHFSLPINL
jgi:hypothetical protein